MKNRKGIFAIYIGIISVLVSTIVLSVGMSFALYEKYAEGNGTYGEISLRSYYECGSGTENDPFVITRPRHLYNLSRLQGLGVYGEKTYFQLGKVDLGGFDSNGVPMCYADDSSSAQKPYLDMSGSDQDTNPINAIGSEALPFYGEFDGQNVEIKNLNVYANPQDAGLFGYTAHGSIVRDLFLSNVTIHALGYTSDYSDLYSPTSTIGNGASFSYDSNDGSNPIIFTSNNADTEFTYFFADENFDYTAQGSSPIPTVSIVSPSNAYTFSSLISGDLIIENENNQIVPDLEQVFDFFGEKKADENTKFPLQASSCASLIVSSVDRYGQKHSKVLLTIEYDFVLESATSNFVSMGVHIASDHGNNIGLIVGHCDGTVTDCYVYNGAFVTNNGGTGYYSLENGSDLGLIGRVGGTVENVLANESDINVKEGKNIGVLDFTTIYNDVINSSSFVGSQDATQVTAPPVSAGITFNPVSTTKYEQYLRKYQGYYITENNNSVSFKGRTIVTNTDLGVFTVATDPKTPGERYSGENLGRSVVRTEDLAVNGDYYIYYSTGEYNQPYQSTHYNGTSFTNYLNSFNTFNSNYILPGYHLPRKDQITRDSFMAREARQNYFIRFKLDPTYRRGKGFYFSDVDLDTDGGAFLANYFNYKLVDQNNHHIQPGDNKCGVMLKNTLRQEISSLSASFALPDLATKEPGNISRKAYCLVDENNNKYVGNMVNFEIKNDMANVTVVAAPSDKTKPATLGVYKLDDSDFSGSIVGENYEMTFDQTWDNPDYAFFMPTDDHLTYYDYRVNGTTHKGEVGTYNTAGTFTPANNTTNPTIVSEYGYNPSTEYGYDSSKTRLFAHTFCLPRGRYCLGSASDSDQCVPNVFYICAQGQDDGQFDFDDNVFSSVDRVENVDFINMPRFDVNGNENIVIETTATYNPADNKLFNRRCYVALVNSDRSLIGETVPVKITFEYNANTGKFVISAFTYDSTNECFVPLTGQALANVIEHFAVDNYDHPLENGPDKQLTVSLFGNESDGAVLVYPLGD